MKAYKKIGEKFLKKASWVYGELTQLTISAEELTSYRTRRSIVRYLESIIPYDSLNAARAAKKLATLKRKASRDPIVFDCFGGTYLDDELVDTSTIFTEDVKTIQTILACENNPEPIVYTRYSASGGEGEWDIITVDGRSVDRYTASGTRVDWSLVVCGLVQDPDAGYYDMVYIPGKLWCFFPLYMSANEPEEVRDGE